jgi:amidase/aspartyl-tRNA(Asn)/glutamyl-tRNA(Gln) amidotransferase subunit A
VRRVVVADRTSPLGPLPGAVATAFHSAAADLAVLLDVEIERLEPQEVFRDLGDPDTDWFVLAAAEHVNALGRGYVEESFDLMHPSTVAFMRFGLAVGIDDYLAARRRRTAYTRRLDELLGDDGLLLTPTVAVEQWWADGRLTADGAPGMSPPEVFSTAVQNITGHPAVTVPAGRYGSGLPYGLQITAPRWADDRLLDVAALWEAHHPWPRTAPGYDEFSVGATSGVDVPH